MKAEERKGPASSQETKNEVDTCFRIENNHQTYPLKTISNMKNQGKSADLPHFFRNLPYTKKELALIYFPFSDPHVAVNRLMGWVKRCKPCMKPCSTKAIKRHPSGSRRARSSSSRNIWASLRGRAATMRLS